MTPLFELSSKLFPLSDIRGCKNLRNHSLRSGPILPFVLLLLLPLPPLSLLAKSPRVSFGGLGEIYVPPSLPPFPFRFASSSVRPPFFIQDHQALAKLRKVVWKWRDPSDHLIVVQMLVSSFLYIANFCPVTKPSIAVPKLKDHSHY